MIATNSCSIAKVFVYLMNRHFLDTTASFVGDHISFEPYPAFPNVVLAADWAIEMTEKEIWTKS